MTDDEKLSALIRDHATRHKASDALRASVRTQIAIAAVGRERRRPRSSGAGQRFGWLATPAGWLQGLGWRAASVGFALGIAATLLFTPVWRGLEFGDSLEQELVFDHVRALKVGPLTQVASSDRHTVKPWFQGKIDFAPTVFDLKEEGFPLVGGRVEQVAGKPVATLAYMRRLHVMDVFEWPADAVQEPRHYVQRGFNIVHWADGSMQYWIVSDVEHAEIERFVQAWRARATAQ